MPILDIKKNCKPRLDIKGDPIHKESQNYHEVCDYIIMNEQKSKLLVTKDKTSMKYIVGSSIDAGIIEKHHRVAQDLEVSCHLPSRRYKINEQNTMPFKDHNSHELHSVFEVSIHSSEKERFIKKGQKE